GVEQQGLARLRVDAQARLGREPRPRVQRNHGRVAVAACTQSSRCQSTSVLRTSAATHASWSSALVARRVTKAIASCESRRANATRFLKYSRPVAAIHG